MKNVYLYNEDDEYLATIRVPDKTKYIVFHAYSSIISLYSKEPVPRIPGNGYFSHEGIMRYISTYKFYGDKEYCEKRGIRQYALKIEDN